jgi:hypothetical protein
MYEYHWWLGYVLEKYEANEEFKIKFLCPHGPSTSFVFPSQSDELILPMSLILSTITPTSDTGRTYKLSTAEANHMSKFFEDFTMM